MRKQDGSHPTSGSPTLIENGNELPKEGVNVHAFLKLVKLEKPLLIATHNKGKTWN